MESTDGNKKSINWCTGVINLFPHTLQNTFYVFAVGYYKITYLCVCTKITKRYHITNAELVPIEENELKNEGLITVFQSVMPILQVLSQQTGEHTGNGKVQGHIK